MKIEYSTCSDVKSMISILAILSSLEPTTFAQESFKLLATGLLTNFKGTLVSKSFLSVVTESADLLTIRS